MRKNLLAWCGDYCFIAPRAQTALAGLRCNYCYHTATFCMREYPYAIFYRVSVNNSGPDYGEGTREVVRGQGLVVNL
ncbi:MAG TPA: hypothetical protein VKV05_03325 [Terriglobales bacterium]|nr:hypothetical protein [Terriglobales bacterium]